MKDKSENIWARFCIHLVLMIGAASMLLPFFWMVVTSFKTNVEANHIPLIWFPASPNFSWYQTIFDQIPFGLYYMNTIIMTVGRTVPQVLLCAMAAFAFARLNFPGRNVIFVFILAILMVPSQVLLIPNYYEAVLFGWVDSYKALIIPGIFSAYGTFLLRQFFITLPKELEDAAKMDGSSYWTIFWRIMLPLTAPGLAALAFFCTISSWNDFLWPLVVINSDKMKVLSIGINSLQGIHSSEQPLLMAGAVMATIPLIVLFLFMQRYIISGIAFSGIKA